MPNTIVRPPGRRLSTLIPITLFGRLQAYAVRRHTTFTTVVIWALEEFLAREQKAAS